MELLLTGERVDAERAREMGLVWRVVAHDDLMDEARALADRLVAGAPLAQRAMKEVASRAEDLSALDAIRFGETMRSVVVATADAAEGMRGRGGAPCPALAGSLTPVGSPLAGPAALTRPDGAARRTSR